LFEDASAEAWQQTCHAHALGRLRAAKAADHEINAAGEAALPTSL
jgi:hypothetical protein